MKRPSRRTQRNLALAALAGAGVIAAAPAARADLIASESFSYTLGTNLNTQGAIGNGWTSSWAAIGGTSIVSRDMKYSNGDIHIDGGGLVLRLPTSGSTSAASRSFTPQPGTSTVYFSFLFMTQTAPSTDDFIHFMLNNDTNNNNSGGIGDVDTSAASFGARVGDANGGVSTNYTASSYSADTTYLLVGKLEDFNTTTDTPGQHDRMTLWVNPSSFNEAAPGTSWTVSDLDTGGTFSGVEFFTLRVFNLETADLYFMDELRIGSSWEAVVPEPSSLGLLAAGVPAVLRRRRRAG